ncbi:hypothetical protein ACOMHN_053386 [Nucella lapillus]
MLTDKAIASQWGWLVHVVSGSVYNSKNTSNKPWYRENDTKERNAKARQAYEALMTVTLRKPTSPEYKAFSKTVKEKAEQMYSNENFTYGEEEVNSFVGAFHDAVILYALALNESLEAGIPISNGSEITQRMWNRTFEGITGTVSIDANGDRNADYSLLDLDPATETFQVVANYYGNKKKYEPVVGRSIAWAGGRRTPPTDNPECGFDGSKCPPEEPFPEYGIVIIVLGTIIFIVLIAAFFIYRHVKLEAELAEMNWRVRYDDILFGSPSKKTRTEENRKSKRQKRTEHSALDGDGKLQEVESVEELPGEDSVGEGMSSARGRRGDQSGSSSVRGGSKAARVPSSRASGRGLVDVSAIHETVLTRVNDTLLAFKSGGESDANPVLSQLIPALATAVAVAVGEVMKTVTGEVEECLAARSSSASDELVMTNLARLTYENDRMNQYTRRESLRIAGVAVQQGETALDVKQKALKVFADAVVAVVPDDIAAVHRAGKARSGTQPVLVRFVSRRKRREVMEKKKTLKKKPGYKGIFPERRPDPAPRASPGLC